MLPEGGHNRAADSTYFILKRRKVKELNSEVLAKTQDIPVMLVNKFFVKSRIEELRKCSQQIQVKLF